MGVHLLELDLMLGDWGAGAVEDEEAGTRGSLVDGANEPALEFVFILSTYTSLLLFRIW